MLQHRPRDAAAPAAALQRQRQAALREDRGPNCLHLPNPPWSQSNPVRHQPDFNDGVDEPTGKGTSRVVPNQYFRTSAGTSQENDRCAPPRPAPGVTADDVPDLGLLLVGLMARGAEVSLR